jgi:putative DNA primase/helicase
VKDASSDVDKIRAWWSQWPDANIGIATGTPSGFDALDVDPRHGGDETLWGLEQEFGVLPATVQSLTGGGGSHVLFRHHSGGKNLIGQLGDGLDFKTSGGYIVAPPSLHASGRLYCWEGASRPNEVVVADPPVWLLERMRRSTNGNRKHVAAAPIADTIQHGKQHSTLVSLAGSMRRRGLDADAIFAALWVVNQRRCEKPGTEEAIRKIARSVCQYRPDPTADIFESPAVSSDSAAGQGTPDLLRRPYTDSGNAERLIALYGRDIKFCPETKNWRFYDGRRWNSKDTRRVKMLAKRTMRLMYAQAADIPDPKIRELAEKHARASESAKAINAMLACAEYEDGIIISAGEFDQDVFLLNVLDCTFNLKSFERQPHRREDLITKLVHFGYDPNAECREFLKFFHKIMGGGERATRMIAYLQKCFGYALTGDVSEKAVFCFFDVKGDGNNGKTTLLEIIRYVIAEYSAQVLIDNLMAHHSRESNASLSDTADLMGNRFVTTSEGEEGQRLAVAKLKYLTQGMGEIKTCRKYETPITFTATHKIFIDSNHRPVVRGSEKAIWNRLRPIPFTVTIPPCEMDKGLLEKLKTEAEGILTWLIEGCQRWQLERLGDPPEVAEASVAWQAESDRFPAFLVEKCIVSLGAWVPTSQLWPAYLNWCEANAERFTLSKTAFDERLQKLGCTQAKRGNGTVRAWLGVRFRTADDDRTEDNGTNENGVSGK